MNTRVVLQGLTVWLAIFLSDSIGANGLMPIASSARQQTCPPPDVPSGGDYKKIIDYATSRNKNNSRKPTDELVYLPGDEIEYSCKEGLVLMGKKRMSCTFSGEWKGSTPFCDKPVNVTNVFMTTYNSRGVKKIIDGSLSSCYDWDTKKGDIQIPLDNKVNVRAMRFYIYNESAALDVVTKRGKCGVIQEKIGLSQWIMLECEDNQTLAEFVRFTNASKHNGYVYLCEVQIFVRDGCDTPPKFFVTNGHLEFGRKKAILVCDAGYRARNDRVVCEKNVWKSFSLECVENMCLGRIGNGSLTNGQWELVRSPNSDRGDVPGAKKEIICNIGFKKDGKPEIVTCHKNGTWTWTNATCKAGKEQKSRIIVIASVCVAVVLVLFFLMGLSIYLIRHRDKNVVVVYKTSTDGSNAAYSEVGYSGLQYESIQSPPLPPTTPRPPFPPQALKEGCLLSDDSQSTLKRSNVKTPADIAFGTLKASTVYGT